MSTPCIGAPTRMIATAMSSRPAVSARTASRCAKSAAGSQWKYVDNDKSDSGGRRRTYERMLAEIRARLIDAVVVWDLDRLHRRPSNSNTSLGWPGEKRLAVTSVGGDADLSTDNGRLFARSRAWSPTGEICVSGTD